MSEMPFRKLLAPALLLAGALTTSIAIAYFSVVVPILVKLAVCALLGFVAWASWAGYRQNRGLNREWPLNLLIIALSIVGIAVLIASIPG